MSPQAELQGEENRDFNCAEAEVLGRWWRWVVGLVIALVAVLLSRWAQYHLCLATGSFLCPVSGDWAGVDG